MQIETPWEKRENGYSRPHLFIRIYDLINEQLRVLIRMTFSTNNFCPILANGPQVWFMAIHAIQPFVHMESMLPDRNLIAMALAGAGGRGGNNLPMGFMALMAEQARHGAASGDTGMAFDTPVLRNHRGRLF